MMYSNLSMNLSASSSFRFTSTFVLLPGFLFSTFDHKNFSGKEEEKTQTFCKPNPFCSIRLYVKKERTSAAEYRGSEGCVTTISAFRQDWFSRISPIAVLYSLWSMHQVNVVRKNESVKKAHSTSRVYGLNLYKISVLMSFFRVCLII